LRPPRSRAAPGRGAVRGGTPASSIEVPRGMACSMSHGSVRRSNVKTSWPRSRRAARRGVAHGLAAIASAASISVPSAAARKVSIGTAPFPSHSRIGAGPTARRVGRRPGMPGRSIRAAYRPGRSDGSSLSPQRSNWPGRSGREPRARRSSAGGALGTPPDPLRTFTVVAEREDVTRTAEALARGGGPSRHPALRSGALTWQRNNFRR